jgi:hypothetical protein
MKINSLIIVVTLLIFGCGTGVNDVDPNDDSSVDSSVDSSDDSINQRSSALSSNEKSPTNNSLLPSSSEELISSVNVEWELQEHQNSVQFVLSRNNLQSDSVRMIVHPSGKGVAMVVDSARFDRFHNCDMYVGTSSSVDRNLMKDIMEPLHQLFLDSFDFAVFVNNSEKRGDCGYKAAFKNLKNNTEGIGKVPWNFVQNGFVNEGYQGYIHIPQRNYLLRGPILHEIVHNWSNYSVESVNKNHWGVLGVGGYLGGWDPQTLVEVTSGVYCAGGQPGFREFATGGVANNVVQYAPLELYLMGLLPADSVPDIIIPHNFRYNAYDSLRSCFTTDSLQAYTIQELVADNGQRIPAYGTAPTRFSMIVVMLSAEIPTENEWGFVLSTVDTLVSKEPLLNHRHNFYSATGGRGELVLPDLLEMLE